MAGPLKVSELVRFRDGVAAQFFPLSGERVTLSATDTSTAEAALPTGARLVVLRATGPIMYRFGATGMGAAAVDDDSVLFPPGEAPIVVPFIADVLAAYIRVIRADNETGAYNVQVEKVNTVG